MPDVVPTHRLTHEASLKMLAAGVAKANELGCKVSLAVVDQSCRLIAFLMMDGARHFSIITTQRKAITAASQRMPTGYAPEENALSMTVRMGDFTNVPGGFPITVAGEVIGAVAAGGAKGYFKDEGLDIEFVTTPGMAQVTTSHSVKFDSVFERPLESVYNDGGIDQYRMCEWGIMKRAVEAECDGLRGRKIVALGASMSKFAIVVAGDSDIYEPEMLKDKPIAVTPNNGSHFVTLKMIEGFLAQEHVKTTNAGSMPKRIEALRAGKVVAVSLMEPWISVAQKMGLRILIESHSTR